MEDSLIERQLNLVFPICFLQRRYFTTSHTSPARLTGVCRALADRPLHVTSRPRVLTGVSYEKCGCNIIRRKRNDSIGVAYMGDSFAGKVVVVTGAAHRRSRCFNIFMGRSTSSGPAGLRAPTALKIYSSLPKVDRENAWRADRKLCSLDQAEKSYDHAFSRCSKSGSEEGADFG